MKTKAVVLLSGGLDSTTCLYLAANENDKIAAISFNYGQRHSRELQAAHKVYGTMVRTYPGRSDRMPVTVTIHGLVLPTTSLVNKALDLPKNRDESRMAEDIPSTYVPLRNSIMLAAAFSFAESIGASKVYAGFNAVDYSGYPDCRPEYVEAMAKALNLGSKQGSSGNPIMLSAPLISMTKEQIVRRAIELGVPIHLTRSCYSDLRQPCGECDSCIIRMKALRAAGYTPPRGYESELGVAQ